MTRVKIFFKSIWNGMLGIFHELLLVYFFIFAGFIACLLLWGLFR